MNGEELLNGAIFGHDEFIGHELRKDQLITCCELPSISFAQFFLCTTSASSPSQVEINIKCTRLETFTSSQPSPSLAVACSVSIYPL